MAPPSPPQYTIFGHIMGGIFKSCPTVPKHDILSNNNTHRTMLYLGGQRGIFSKVVQTSSCRILFLSWLSWDCEVWILRKLYRCSRFHWRRWGSSLPCLQTLDTSLRPPIDTSMPVGFSHVRFANQKCPCTRKRDVLQLWTKESQLADMRKDADLQKKMGKFWSKMRRHNDVTF